MSVRGAVAASRKYDAPALREANLVAAADMAPYIDGIEEAHLEHGRIADATTIEAVELDAAAHAIKGMYSQAIQGQRLTAWRGLSLSLGFGFNAAGSSASASASAA